MALQVFQGFLGGLELDDVGNVKLLEDDVEQFDVESVRLAVVVDERVWPQVPRIFVDERGVLRIGYFFCFYFLLTLRYDFFPFKTGCIY